jgi:malate dehydrogenase
VKNVIIWGNHSVTQVPDATHATINGKPATEVTEENETVRHWIVGRVGL